MNAKQREILHQAKVKIYVGALFSSIWVGTIFWIIATVFVLGAGYYRSMDHAISVMFGAWFVIVAIVYATLYAKSQPKIRIIQHKIENASSTPPR